MRRWLRRLLNAAVGALLCQTPPTAVLAVGWTQRAMRRAIVRSWHEGAGDGPFEDFARADESTRDAARIPGWLAAELPEAGWRARLAGLARNARQGAAVTLNTWVLTLPGCGLWLFAWYDGWNNSFTKGYEQAFVGPGVGLLGVALFILAMLYVPMAQARQASTGRWRSFYDFGLVAGLVRQRWWACVRLAALYSVLSIPVMALKTAPIGFDRSDTYAGLSDAEVLEALQNYFFLAALFVFSAFVWVRLAAARIYAAALVEGVRAGAVLPDALGERERTTLSRLDLLHTEPAASRHPIVRAVRGTTRLAWRTAAVAAAALVWFSFVAQIFVSEFLNYHPLVGWLNQPLVQLPWFRYVPAALGG